MGQEQAGSSIATRIGIILTIITVIISGINAIPAFLALRGKEAYVVYEVTQSRMVFPEDSNRTAIRELLKEKQIPDSFGKIRLSNRGDVPSREALITVAVPGVIIAEKTDPDPNSKPAWVKISKEYDPKADPSRIRYTLNELGLVRALEVNVSYISEPFGDVSWDVFYDGKPAIRVESIATVPENARAISFAPALTILGIGILLSIVVFVTIKYREYLMPPLLRKTPRVLAAYKPWQRYKNSVILELAKNPLASIESITEGDFKAKEPENFWDGILNITGKRLVVEVHTSGQQWEGIIGDINEQTTYSLRLLSMARSDPKNVSWVAMVNDDDCWSEEPGLRVKNLLNSLSRGEGAPEFLFVSGSPSDVAASIFRYLKVTQPNRNDGRNSAEEVKDSIGEPSTSDAA